MGQILSGTLTRGSSSAAGLDVTSAETVVLLAGESALIRTGLVIAVPEGHVGILKSRSGMSVKFKIEVGAGVIDSDYRGEVRVHLYNHGYDSYKVNKGDRISQLLTIPINQCEYTQVEVLSETNRQENGFGSSGK